MNAASLGVSNLYQGTNDFLQVAVNNGGFAVGCGTCALGSFNITSFQEADDMDIVRGKHQIAFGVDLIRTRDTQNNHYQDNGVFNFSGQYSNDPLLDFLTGKMNSFSQSGPQLNDLRQTVFGLYVQDTFHVTPRWWSTSACAGSRCCRNTITLTAAAHFRALPSTRARSASVYVNAPAGSLFYGDPGISNAFTEQEAR